MITLHIENQQGEARSIEVEPTGSLMEAIRANGFPELQALCGGCCSCATCHVVIEPKFLAGLPAMSDDEDDLLDGSDHREESSRLSCQVPLTGEMDGLKLRIAVMD
ncbi:2Fe-2S iron-sulfur cluster-binding protein [Alteraurantiacibacter aquimixticola]|uniref:2Fe-2S iron-sulfur cluster binding domain-containing protein n=1 Tax=Alteraurantiacibacter aquimixticola TaxID=2489173 RepID=A0A4T3F1I7_9SPHN|nr:2Fe-2S iron-sulfur cluster-binding protein [Alteraurantiacibacter aquimixticola]TIX49817.1 2Fe-2S iron-sulfur cluster binding domain-containing protein [Alteraurantiacibacter aquimixticola]